MVQALQKQLEQLEASMGEPEERPSKARKTSAPTHRPEEEKYVSEDDLDGESFDDQAEQLYNCHVNLRSLLRKCVHDDAAWAYKDMADEDGLSEDAHNPKPQAADTGLQSSLEVSLK